MKIREFIFITSFVTIIFGINTSAQITNNQTDNFEDGSVHGWSEGSVSPNPPVNIADGGPGGTADNYLQNVSSGSGGAGGRLVMFNTAQWKGDYTSVGVTHIIMQLNNLGSNNLEIRLAFSGSGGRFSSTNAVLLSAGSGWQMAVFPIGQSDLTAVSGGTDVNATLSNVTELRILHNTSPSWQGIPIAVTLGVDNIIASETPVPVELTVFNVPNTIQLEQNYPNPFNPSTTIKYSIPSVETGYVPSLLLIVYDILGNEVSILANKKHTQGKYEIEFDGSELTSGIYFYRIRAGEFVETKKMIMLK
jgi:Secretion system C-terminal sorting domain